MGTFIRTEMSKSYRSLSTYKWFSTEYVVFHQNLGAAMSHITRIHSKSLWPRQLTVEDMQKLKKDRLISSLSKRSPKDAGMQRAPSCIYPVPEPSRELWYLVPQNTPLSKGPPLHAEVLQQVEHSKKNHVQQIPQLQTASQASLTSYTLTECIWNSLTPSINCLLACRD